MKRDQKVIKSIWLGQKEQEKFDVGQPGHELGENNCTRWCSRCLQWIRPKDFNTECNPASHKEHQDG